MKAMCTVRISILKLLTILCISCSGGGNDGGVIENAESLIPRDADDKRSPSSKDVFGEVAPESSTRKVLEQIFELDCSGTQASPSVCKIDDFEKAYITSADIVIEYSENKCQENLTWRVSDDSESIETWDGCDATFNVEVASKDDTFETETININDLANDENESIRFADIDTNSLGKLKLGDYIDVESLSEFNEEKDSLLIIETNETLLKLKIDFKKVDESSKKKKTEEKLYLLDAQMELIKIIQVNGNKNQLIINNLKESKFILIPMEKNVEAVTKFYKK